MYGTVTYFPEHFYGYLFCYLKLTCVADPDADQHIFIPDPDFSVTDLDFSIPDPESGIFYPGSESATLILTKI